MISLNQIVKSKETGRGKVAVLDHLNLSISKGEYISIVGFNKCGKTALIKILAMMDRDFYGHYQFGEYSLESLDDASFQKFRLENIGLVYKNFNIVDYFTLKENILLPLRFMEKDKKQVYERAKYLCHLFAINHKKNHLASQVNQLIKTKTAIAQALILNPTLLLADDILKGLTNEEVRLLIDLLAKLNENGLTIILTSENLRDANLFHRKIFIHEGRVFTDYPFT